jgi:hypothetical protein
MNNAVKAVPMRIVVWILLFAGLLSACNFPGFRREVAGLSVEELRQTLAAQAGGTPGAVSTGQPTLLPEAVPPFAGLKTATPQGQAGAALQPLATGGSGRVLYITQSGDTLPALAIRFAVQVEEIASEPPLPPSGLLPAGHELWIPNVLDQPRYPSAALPDSELINSPAAAGFDIQAAIDAQNGYLSRYSETVQGKSLSGAQIVERVAVESSVNPRFLLALLELQSGWVRGLPGARIGEKYPIGFRVSGWEGLYRELVVTATHLNMGYYGWRDGSLTDLKFRDGRVVRLAPGINAGTAAVQTLLGKLYQSGDWEGAVYGAQGILELYRQMFGDPWRRAAQFGDLFPTGVVQPALQLPFLPGERWSLTGGPHPSWKTGSPRGAIDLAPVTGEKGCVVSRAWVTASAAGLVLRSARNVVAIDLDGDGFEQTGWVLIYMHVADKERISAGTWVQTDDRLGHPSCEGGTSTGTHVHIARKFNGEWIPADGALPFDLGGWVVYAGEKNYQGGMRKGEQEAVASPVGPRTSIIQR